MIQEIEEKLKRFASIGKYGLFLVSEKTFDGLTKDRYSPDSFEHYGFRACRVANIPVLFQSGIADDAIVTIEQELIDILAKNNAT